MLTQCFVVLLCIIVRSVNGFGNQKLHSHQPVSDCVVEVINKVFPKNISFAYIFNDYPEYFPFNLNNPYVIVNSSQSIHGYYAKYENDYIIEANSVDSLSKTLLNLLRGPIWVRGKFTRGRFLVITAEKDLAALFTLLWRYLLVNVVVVQYENEIDAKNITIFTANRFDDQNNCGQMPNVVHSQQCDSHLSVTFDKYIRNYGGCPIIASLYTDLEPFTLWGKTVSFILDQIEETLNAKVININMNLTTFINAYYSQKTIVIHVYVKGALEISDDSDGFFMENYVWMGYKPLPRSPYITYLVPFNGILWLVTILVLVVVILLWRFILFVAKFSTSSLGIFSDAISLHMGVSISRIPSSMSLTILIAFYLVYIIHIQTAYTSNLINIIVLPRYEDSLSSIYDLENTNIPIYTQKSVYDEYIGVNEQFKHMKDKFIVVPDVGFSRYITSLNDTKHFMVARRSQWHLPRDQPTIIEQHLTGKAPNFFMDKSPGLHHSMCFIMRKGSYFLPSLNKVISFLHEGGIASKLDKSTDYSHLNGEMDYHLQPQFFQNPDEPYVLRVGDKEHDFYTGLTLVQLSGAFTFLIIGLTIAVIVFIIELLTYHLT